MEDRPMSEGPEGRWLVRLTPPAGRSVRDLLELPLSLDIWERDEHGLVAAVGETTLREIERRRLAGVERLCTTAEHERAAARSTGSDPTSQR
jgi:hypothetical protein